ncbi:hypothetical protein RKD47_000021 [Streptomyces albogriseolus]
MWAKLEAAKDIKKPTDRSIMHREQVTAILRSRNGVINLCGRMPAEVDNAGVDGAVQVAHAMTTHQTDVGRDRLLLRRRRRHRRLERLHRQNAHTAASTSVPRLRARRSELRASGGVEDLPGHPASVVGGEEGHHVGHVLGAAHPAEGGELGRGSFGGLVAA